MVEFTHSKGEKMQNLIKIPKRFFDDHKERDLDTPQIIKETKTNYWIRSNDPHLAELKSDADYYATMWDMGSFDKWVFGIATSAKATLKALEN